MRYFRPTSVSWWTGVLMILAGVAVAAQAAPDAAEGSSATSAALNTLVAVLTALSGSGGPVDAADLAPGVLLILNGFGLIGVRDAIHRKDEQGEDNNEDRHAEVLATITALASADNYFDEEQEDDDAEFTSYELPEGESKFPPGVRDPYGPGGTRE